VHTSCFNLPTNKNNINRKQVCLKKNKTLFVSGHPYHNIYHGPVRLKGDG